MLHGAARTLVTGVALYALDRSGPHHEPPAAKMAVKLVALLVLSVLVRI
jgi:hypothetical protein